MSHDPTRDDPTSQPGPNGEPSHDERLEGGRIIAWLDGQEDRLITRLRTLVDINTGLDNHAGQARTLDLLQRKYEKLGFVCRRLRHDQGFVHLIAARPAKSADATKVLLLGHIDTVFGEQTSFLTFQREGE